MHRVLTGYHDFWLRVLQVNFGRLPPPKLHPLSTQPSNPFHFQIRCIYARFSGVRPGQLAALAALSHLAGKRVPIVRDQ